MSPARPYRALCLAGLTGIALLAACVDSEAYVPLALGDEVAFGDEVQPVLVERCGTASCHGNDKRPFALFALGARRLDPNELFTDTPLTSQEQRANFLRASAFVHDLDDSSSLVRKPLAPGDGGIRHEGGVIFESVEENDHRSIADWAASVPKPRGDS